MKTQSVQAQSPRTLLKLSFALCGPALLSTVLCGSVRADVPPPPASTIPDSVQIHRIWNGELVNPGEYPEVFYITMTGASDEGSTEAICTGVLVHPKLILTAAHCFKGSMSIDRIGNGTNSSRRKFRGVTAKHSLKRTHPLFRQKRADTLLEMAANARWDLAFLVLKNEMTDIPLPAIQVHSDPSGAMELIGKAAKLVGYGFEKYRKVLLWNSSVGIKRSGENRIQQILPGMILMNEKTGGALPGDSGGPVFLESSEGRTVVGINHSMIIDHRKEYVGTSAHLFSTDSLCWVKKTSGIDFIPELACPTEGATP